MSAETETDSSTPVALILGVMGLMCVAFAAVVLVAPAWSGGAAGYQFDTPGGRVEFMTVYGGFYLGLGVFWLVCARRPSLREAGAAALALTSTGAAVARGFGIARFAAVDPQTLVLFAGEVAFTGIGWMAWYWSRDTESA